MKTGRSPFIRVAVDTHVHLYPHYDLARLLDAAIANLRRAAPTAGARALCLTERAGQSFFAQLASGQLRPTGWQVSSTPEANTLLARGPDGQEIYLMAGRQIVTAEKMEVLALGVDLALRDGAPIRDVLARVRDGGAGPVLPWGLGKWWGQRGHLLRELLSAATPGDFALGDTYLLPALAPRPPALRAAARRGFRVLAGTDPLDRVGEEPLVGRYGILAEGDFDPQRPATSLLALLRNPAIPLTTIGRRGSLLETLRRR